MAQAFARPDEDIEKVLRRFKRQVKEEEILQNLRERESYEKPSEQRKKVKRQRERANQKRLKMEDF
jgi:small subunit ribosomal protein S21